MGSPTSHNKSYVVSHNTSIDTNSLEVHENVPAKRFQLIASDKNTIVKDIRKTNAYYEDNVLTNMNNEDEPHVELKRSTLNKAKLRKRLRKENETQYKASQRMQKANYRLRHREGDDTQLKLKEKYHKANSRKTLRATNDTQVKLKEKTHKANSRKTLRETNVTQVKLNEKSHQANSRMTLRETNDTQFKLNEKTRKANSRMRLRETNDSQVKLKEKTHKANSRKTLRETNDTQVKLKEKTFQSNSRIRQKQNNKEVTTQQRLYENERQQKYRKRSSISITSTIQTFRSKIKEGPTYICCSCQLLLYRHNVKKFVNDHYSAALLADCTNNIDSFDHMRYICNSCHNSLCKGYIPPLSVGNLLQLTEIPDVLKNLSSLEVTLISKRIPFMKILGLPRGKQKAVHGCVVNVPVDPDETCGILPRLPSSATLTVKLKRKLQYRGHVIKQVIRPWKILSALYYLKMNNKHYTDVAINEQWQEDASTENPNLWESLTNYHGSDNDESVMPDAVVCQKDNDNIENTKSNDQMDVIDIQINTSDQTETVRSHSEQGKANHDIQESDINTPEAKRHEHTSEPNVQDINEAQSDSDLDNDNEEQQQDVRTKLAGLPYDSCLQPKDLSADSDFILSLAPGEGKKPESFHSDQFSEELSFPNMFPDGCFGFSCKRPKKITMKQYFKSRILNHDTRFSSSIEYLFYAQYRCEAKDISDCLSIALRKCRGEVQTNRVTAGQIKEAENMRQLTRNDLSYRFLQKVRGFLAYYNKMLYGLFGMIRQLGASTWFLTLSAADIWWTDTI